MNKIQKPEIKEYIAIEKAIAKLHKQLSNVEKDIIQKYCPFKKGDNVIYTEWWRGNNKDYFGTIRNIKFELKDESIDGKWVICVEPTTKDFKIPKGSFNKSFKYLGDHKDDVIIKA